MSTPGIIAIRIVRGNTVFHVHGDKAGLEGVWLAKGQVEGIYDAPIKSTWKTGAFQVGATQKAVKHLFRDMELGFHIIETATTSFEWNESVFRQIFFYEEDQWSEDPIPTTIEVITELSGTRKLDVLMYEQPAFTTKIDALKQQYGNPIMKLRAGDPWWYEDDVISEFTSTSTSAAGTVVVSNPTDQIMYHKWILTPAATSGSAIWTLPDFQWVGDPGAREPGGTYGARYLNDIEVTEANGGAVGDTDRQELMWRDANDTNILGQMGAQKILIYPIPPYTQEFYLPVSYKGATGGATCQLVQPRRWSRPYGMEGVTVVEPLTPQDVTLRFTTPGSYEFQIPDWCERLDVVIAPAGGGGEGGNLLTIGSGGEVGSWVYDTIIRGVDIPYDTHQLKGVIGAGGAGGYGYELFGAGGVDGQNGELTTVVASGMTTMSATGGIGGSTGTVEGAGLADLTFNGVTYPGCGAEYVAGNHGNHPGGGGAGGWPLLGRGGDGGNAQVWIRAYGWMGS